MSTIPVIDALYSIETPAAPTQIATPSCGQPVEVLVSAMNKCAIEQVVLAPCKRWSCDRHWMCGEIQLDEVLFCMAGRPTRFAGLVAYNPFSIIESLQQVTEAVRERDFRGVYIHTAGSEIELSDRRMYPLYARCVELNAPTLIQVGAGDQNAFGPAAVSELSSVLTDFPDLRVIAGWQGRFHPDTAADFLERHPTVILATDANVSPIEEPAMVEFLARFSGRCIWGSNGLPWRALLQRVRSFDLPKSVLQAFLHDNAIEVFNLARSWRPAAMPEERVACAER